MELKFQFQSCSLFRPNNFEFDMAEHREMPQATPRQSQPVQQSSAFGDWDLRRDNISRPTENQLDSQLDVSSFSASDADTGDDELETPPFFKNR